VNIKEFFRPVDASFSTPHAARKLLHLFAMVVSGSVIAIACLYLRSIFSNEVSERSDHMNQAITEAQHFFASRQMLLNVLVLSSVRNVTMAAENTIAVPTEERHIVLGDAKKSWSIWLSKRIQGHMRQNAANLLYVSGRKNPVVRRLFTVSPASAEVPDSVLRQLVAPPQELGTNYEHVWLKDHTVADSPLYVFSRLDARTPDSGWLGLEIQIPDMMNELENGESGDFILLDGSSTVLFSMASEPVRYSPSQLQSDFSFGFIGTGFIPNKLAIRKRMDFSDWQIVYAFDLGSLLWVLLWPLLISVLLCGALIWLLRYLVQRIDRRLIVPASQRIEELVESEAFSRKIIHIAPVALCVLRRQDGSVVLENSLAQQWLGAGDERNRLSRGWIRRAFDDIEKDSTDDFETAGGRQLYLSFAATRYEREDVLICAFSDISARRQVELALEQARQSADAANEAKSLFLATMSHEIRTPLYGVLGTLELLARTELNHRQQNYLKAIEGSSANLLQLICDVLDVSKIEAGQMTLELDRFSPLALTQEAVLSYAGVAQGKGIQMFSCIDPGIPDWLNGDAPRIRQVLNNLLNNAVKFTDSGRITLRLRVDDGDDERVTLSWQVSDTGQGISAEDQRVLFEPFCQASKNTNVVAGTGLGLSICNRLVDLMNGTIRLVSEPGLGTSFTVQLTLERRDAMATDKTYEPLLFAPVYVASPVRELAQSISGWLSRWGANAQLYTADDGLQIQDGAVLLELHLGRFRRPLVADWAGSRVIACSEVFNLQSETEACQCVNFNSLQELRRAVAQAQSRDQRSVQSQPSRGSSPDGELDMHVLVVEDNVINRLILRDQLEVLGCKVELASDGLEALQRVHEAAFDLILTDINMPRMNGYELAQQLREQGYATPIIGATASALLEDRERCLASGMNQCLIKPFALPALHACLMPYAKSQQ
jgi:two-component system capsular synthesis sensor histidine kinase RcsC